MKLSIKNVGILSKVDLEINGITVIAGENDTGKSTISKSLYAIFNGCYRLEERIINTKLNTIIDEVFEYLEKSYTPRYIPDYLREKYIGKERIVEVLQSKLNLEKESIKNLVNEIVKNINEEKNFFYSEMLRRDDVDEIENDSLLEDLTKKINKIIQMNDEIINKLLEEEFIGEFNSQVNNVSSNESSQINMIIKNMNIGVEIIEGKANLKNTEDAKKIYSKIEYIDSISILDTLNRKSHHSNQLVEDLQSEKKPNLVNALEIEEKIKGIFNKVTKRGIGELVFSKTLLNTKVFYKSNDTNIESKPLDIRNVSAGLKSFLIIKTLFEKGILEGNGVIILDEPEVHLHPEWQVLFAELIVLIQKEFNMHILLTTHSPYFLYAVELFTKKYEISGKCKFYFSEKKDEKANLIDVTDDIRIAFNSLTTPFFRLEDMEVKMEEKSCGE